MRENKKKTLDHRRPKSESDYVCSILHLYTLYVRLQFPYGFLWLCRIIHQNTFFSGIPNDTCELSLILENCFKLGYNLRIISLFSKRYPRMRANSVAQPEQPTACCRIITLLNRNV